MAKGNFATGTLSGKLGAYVFARRKGEQISRSWVKPKDAKTTSQGAQRSALTNITRLFQSSPSFFKGAFANKPSRQSDYNALVSANMMKAPRIRLPKNIADSNGGVVAPYVISDGGLQSIIVTGEGVQARTNIAVGADFEIDETTTVAALSAAILANNTFIQEGDQLSYLSIEQYTADGVPRLRARKYELLISSNGSGLARDFIPEFGLSVVGGFIAHGDYVYSGAFAWVLSRKTASKTDVSRQNLIVTDESLYSAYMGDLAIATANKTYNNTNTVFINPGDAEEGSAVVPSNIPSVATVSIQGTRLSPSASAITLAAAGTLAAEALQITGSAFTGTTEIVLAVSGGGKSAQATVPVTLEGGTLMYNTAAVTLTGVKTIADVSITINGYEVYSWTLQDSEGGEEGTWG